MAKPKLLLVDDNSDVRRLFAIGLNQHGFEVKLAAGKTASQEIVEEKDVLTNVSLSNSDDQTMRFFFSQPVVSEAVKNALTARMAGVMRLMSTFKREMHRMEMELATYLKMRQTQSLGTLTRQSQEEIRIPGGRNDQSNLGDWYFSNRRNQYVAFLPRVV